MGGRSECNRRRRSLRIQSHANILGRRPACPMRWDRPSSSAPLWDPQSKRARLQSLVTVLPSPSTVSIPLQCIDGACPSLSLPGGTGIDDVGFEVHGFTLQPPREASNFVAQIPSLGHCALQVRPVTFLKKPLKSLGIGIFPDNANGCDWFGKNHLTFKCSLLHGQPGYVFRWIKASKCWKARGETRAFHP